MQECLPSVRVRKQVGETYKRFEVERICQLLASSRGEQKPLHRTPTSGYRPVRTAYDESMLSCNNNIKL